MAECTVFKLVAGFCSVSQRHPVCSRQSLRTVVLVRSVAEHGRTQLWGAVSQRLPVGWRAGFHLFSVIDDMGINML